MPKLILVKCSDAMIIIHHLPNSRSQRVLWLMEELQLPYQVIIHDRHQSFEPLLSELKKVHPLAKAPICCDGDTTIAETGAIFDYILEKYGEGRLEPLKNSNQRNDFIYWRNFSEATLIPYLVTKLIFNNIACKSPFFVRPLISYVFRQTNQKYLDPNIFAALDMIEKHLANNLWFGGEQFTVADVLLSFSLEAVSGRMITTSTHPKITDFVERIKKRSAYKVAIEKGKWNNENYDDYWKFLKN